MWLTQTKQGTPCALILAIGAVLRIFQFLTNRSLWYDEAMLATNIESRSFAMLTEPLDYQQVAPILFLWIEKLTINLFGINEYSLRLVPLIFGLASLILFARLCQVSMLPASSRILALFLFALSPTLIYYSAETKQYSSDLLVTLTLIYLTTLDNRKNRLYGLCAIGAVAVWLSNIAIIPLCACLSLSFYRDFVDREEKLSIILKRYSLGSGFCVASSFLYYLLFLKDHPHREFMLGFWSPRNAFMPWPNHILKYVTWAHSSIHMVFAKLLTFPENAHLYLLPALLALIGFAMMAKKWDGWLTYLLLSMAVFHLVLSALYIYPFHSRFILYLSPLLLLCVACGADTVSSYLARKTNLWALRYFLVAPIVAAYPLNLARDYPFEREEFRKTAACIIKSGYPLSSLYLDYHAEMAFRIYQHIDPLLPANTVVEGKLVNFSAQDMEKEFAFIDGEHWIIFARLRTEQEQSLTNLLQDKALIVHTCRQTGSGALFIKTPK